MGPYGGELVGRPPLAGPFLATLFSLDRQDKHEQPFWEHRTAALSDGRTAASGRLLLQTASETCSEVRRFSSGVHPALTELHRLNPGKIPDPFEFRR
jgi:hypothetical protein